MDQGQKIQENQVIQESGGSLQDTPQVSLEAVQVVVAPVVVPVVTQGHVEGETPVVVASKVNFDRWSLPTGFEHLSMSVSEYNYVFGKF